MAEQMEIKSFFRVGIVVRDAWKTFKFFETYFGADRAAIDKSDLRTDCRYKDMTFNGKPEDYPTLYLIFPLGGIELEIMQPLDGRGPYADFLKDHGEGLHHFNVDVDDVDKFDRIMQALSAPMISQGHIESTLFKYYDARDTLGMIIETTAHKDFDA